MPPNFGVLVISHVNLNYCLHCLQTSTNPKLLTTTPSSTTTTTQGTATHKHYKRYISRQTFINKVTKAIFIQLSRKWQFRPPPLPKKSSRPLPCPSPLRWNLRICLISFLATIHDLVLIWFQRMFQWFILKFHSQFLFSK